MKGMIFMKLVWEDVYDIFDEVSLWENGHDMYWYRLMWGLMEYRHMNCYNTESDRVKVISRAFAIIKIYKEFISRCFDDDEIEEAFDSASYEISEYLHNDDDVHDIFRALHEELGTIRTFYSMFITCIEFRDGKISYADDEYESNEEDSYSEESDGTENEYDLYSDEFLSAEYEEEEYEYVFESDTPEDSAEDYYYSFESYLNVLATSSMSLVSDFTPEKVAGYMYIARNMKN